MTAPLTNKQAAQMLARQMAELNRRLRQQAASAAKAQAAKARAARFAR